MWLTSLFLLAIIILTIATLVSGIAAMCLKDRAQRIAIDAVLALATLVLVVGYSATFLPKKESKLGKSALESLKMSVASQADMVGVDILESEYVDRLKQPWRSVAAIDGFKPLKDRLATSERWLRKIHLSHRDKPGLAARFAIVVHENGGDAAAVLNHYRRSHKEYAPLIEALLAIYPPAGEHRAKALESNILTAPSDQPKEGDARDDPGDRVDAPDHLDHLHHLDDPPAAGNSTMTDRADGEESQKLETMSPETQLAAINSFLPDGWYRRKALGTLYAREKDRSALDKLSNDASLSFNGWREHLLVYNIMHLLFALIGVAAIFFAIKTKPAAGAAELPSYDFRKVYGCILSNIYAGFMTGFAAGLTIGIVVGFCSALATRQHSQFTVGDLSLPFQVFVVLGSAASTFAAVYFFVARPAKTSIWRMIKGAQPLPLTAILKNAFFCFCINVALSTAVVCTTRLVTPSHSSVHTALQRQMAEAIASLNPMLICWYAFIICALAPVVEEILFRGLLYPLLKSRWGLACAVLVSSALFALVHFNLSAFFLYMSLGAVLALAYEKTRSLSVPIVAHATWNLWVLLTITWLMPR